MLEYKPHKKGIAPNRVAVDLKKLPLLDKTPHIADRSQRTFWNRAEVFLERDLEEALWVEILAFETLASIYFLIRST